MSSLFRRLLSIPIALILGQPDLSRLLAADPVLVVVDADRRQLAEQRQEAAERFSCRDALLPFQLSEGKSAYHVNNPDHFAGRTGKVYLNHDSGRMIVARFWTVSGQNVFDEFIEMLISARGNGVTVDGTASHKSIRTSSVIQKGSVTLRWLDTFVCFEDNVIFLSDSEDILAVDHEDGRTLNEVISKSGDADWFSWVSPDRVDIRIREQFVATLSQQLEFLLQKRDDEDLSTFRARETRLKSYFEAARIALFDVEEATASIQFPSDDSGFHFRANLISRPNSALQRALDASKIESNLHIAEPKSSIGVVRLCINLPLPYRPPIADLLARWVPDFALPQPLADLLSDQERVDVLLRYGAGADGDPVVLGGIGIEGPMMATEELATSTQRREPIVFPSMRYVSLERLDKAVLFSVTQEPSRLLASADNSNSALPSSNGILDLDVNLGEVRRWENRENANLCLTEVEQLHQKFFRRNLATLDNAQPPSHSLLHHVMEGGDWKIRVRVNASGEQLVVLGDVGRDAYHFHLVKQMLDDAAMIK